MLNTNRASLLTDRAAMDATRLLPSGGRAAAPMDWERRAADGGL